MKIICASCDAREPIWHVWKFCMLKNWPDCPFPWLILSNERNVAGFNNLPIGPDIGWCTNLIKALTQIPDDLILLCMDDDLIAYAPDKNTENWTRNILHAEQLMQTDTTIGAIAVSPASDPEINYLAWDRVGEMDRALHPFKRVTLSAMRIWRKPFLLRLLQDVLKNMDPTKEENDKGWFGAVFFEKIGTLLTANASNYPERFLASKRCYRGLIETFGGIGTRGGKFMYHPIESWWLFNEGLNIKSIPGFEKFLPLWIPPGLTRDELSKMERISKG